MTTYGTGTYGGGYYGGVAPTPDFSIFTAQQDPPLADTSEPPEALPPSSEPSGSANTEQE